MRKRGADIHVGARPNLKPRKADAIAEGQLALVKLPPAVVYDAIGQAVALMDTMTRQRHRLLDGETVEQARQRLNLPQTEPPGFALHRHVEDDPMAVSVDLGAS